MSGFNQIQVISFGRPKNTWQSIVEDYNQRLNRLINFEHLILKEPHGTPNQVKSASSQLVDKHSKYPLVIFDERGRQVDSRQFADLLGSLGKASLVIGSSYGLEQRSMDQADKVIALSKMVLPHEMARIIVLEQIYRAHAILNNHPYHHD